MEKVQDNGVIIRLYLLGQLAEEERRQFEELLMSRDESFEELLAAEDELIDSYVGGALSAREREQFELYFLATPERRRKVSFARTLSRYISERGGEKAFAQNVADARAAPNAAPNAAPKWSRYLPPFLRMENPLAGFSFAAILLLVLFGGVWLVVNNLRDPARGGAVVAVTLTPGQVRDSGAEVKTVSISPDIGAAELRLTLATTEHQSFRAVVNPVGEERDAFVAEDLKPLKSDTGSFVVVNVPADVLDAGDYRVRLYGSGGGEDEVVDSYYFRVRLK